MTGVEILTSTEVATEFSYNFVAFWIFFGIIFAIFAILGLAFSISACDYSNLVLFIIFGILLGLVFGLLAGNATHEPVSYETQYKVTISPEVSMSDFYEQYEVIDQDGKIFTVRERK